MSLLEKKPLLILGGGLIGLSIAYELGRKGKTVHILSRQRSEAAGFVAAGMLAPHAEGLRSGMLKLGQLSLSRIPSWVANIEKQSGLECGLKNSGIIVPFANTDQRDQYPTEQFGEILNRKELEQEIPNIENEWQTGLLFTQDGQIDNRRRLMRALEKACVEVGVGFQEGVEVTELVESNSVLQEVQIINAKGERRNIACNEAVLCSGAWSNQILKKIPVFPVKGQMLSIQGPKNALKRIIFGPGTYLVPREDGLIVVGATSERNAGFTQGLTPAGQQVLHQGIARLLSCANQWPQMERWWGFRPCTPDEEPLLGESDLQGLWLATGHYRNGVLLAAITAELISKSICREELSYEETQIMKQFNWNRF